MINKLEDSTGYHPDKNEKLEPEYIKYIFSESENSDFSPQSSSSKPLYSDYSEQIANNKVKIIIFTGITTKQEKLKSWNQKMEYLIKK